MRFQIRFTSLTAAAGGEVAWEGELAFEDVETSDLRRIAPGALEWRTLPLTLMAQVETAPGHDGARVAGRIDSISRDGAAIVGSGVFAGEFGLEVAALVEAEVLRGVSVDMAVHEYEIEPVETDDAEAGDGEEDLLDMLLGPEGVFVVLRGELLGATLTPFPAFAEARLRITGTIPADDGEAVEAGEAAGAAAVLAVTISGEVSTACADCDETVAVADDLHAAAQRLADRVGVAVSWTTVQDAAAGRVGYAGLAQPAAILASAAGLAPLHPPAGWFDDPALSAPTALTVTDDGRVFGHLATWGTCHIGLAGCRTAPRSRSGYAYFRLGEVVTAEGGRVATGKITLDGPHADVKLARVDATRHYDDTCTAVADVAAGEDAHGIWIAGAVRPDVPAETVRVLRASSISGDWRSVDGRLELVGALAVNVPGFPVPRALVASGEVRALVASFRGAAGVDVPMSLLRRAGVLERFALRAAG